MTTIIRTIAATLAVVTASLNVGLARAQATGPSHPALTGAWDRYGALNPDPRVTAAPPVPPPPPAPSFFIGFHFH